MMRLTRSSRERREPRQAEVKFEEDEMIPKSVKSPTHSKKAVNMHEFAALARSSLNGISQVVKDHVTKPTSLAQGRVAHLIEWKGWPKPKEPPPGAHSHFNSYCHLTEGEKEARFAKGVEEQFAIAEAKLRAWASVDDDEEEEEEEEQDSNGTNFTQPERQTHMFSVAATANQNPACEVPCQAEADDSEAPPCGSPLGSSGSNSRLLHDRFVPHDDPHSTQTHSPTLHGNHTGPFLEEGPLGGEGQTAQLQQENHRHGEICVHHKSEWRPRGRSSRFDSCYSTSHSESPGEEDEEVEEDDDDEEGSVFHEGHAWHPSPGRFYSDRASSGVASFDEEEERDEAVESKEGKEHLI